MVGIDGARGFGLETREIMMAQCQLVRRHPESSTWTTTWIPEQYAQVGTIVPLLMNGYCDQIVQWEVDKVLARGLRQASDALAGWIL